MENLNVTVFTEILRDVGVLKWLSTTLGLTEAEAVSECELAFGTVVEQLIPHVYEKADE